MKLVLSWAWCIAMGAALVVGFWIIGGWRVFAGIAGIVLFAWISANAIANVVNHYRCNK